MAAGLALAALSSSATAAVIPVSIPGDTVANDGACSLREAVGAANTDSASGAALGECVAGAGADIVLLGPGTFTLTRSGAADADLNSTGDLDATGELTLRGAGATVTTIDASSMTPPRDRVLDVKVGATVTVDSLAITGGRAPDGTNGATVNGAAGSPGADATGAAGQAAAGGGGIRNAGTLLVTASRLSGNQTGRGGDGGAGIGGAGTTAGSHGGAGTGGVAGEGGSGGGIYSSGVLTVVNSTITANRAGDGGTGGTGNGGSGGSTSYGGNGSAKRAGNGGVGGGIAAGGTVTLNGATVSQNFSGAGGAGGQAGGGNGGASSSAGSGGAADGADGGRGGDGAGLFTAAITTVVGSTFSGNSAGAGGGGGNAGAGASPSCPVGLSNASAGPGGHAGDGGGVWSAGGDPKTLTNATVTANSVAAGADGGGAFGCNPHRGSGGEGGTGAGVANAGGGPLPLVHVTVAGNGAPGAGGQPGNSGTLGVAGAAGAASAIDSSAGTTTSLRNSVTTGTCKTPISDGGGNIRLTATTCPGTTADPKLGPLADNSGPTQTMSVGPGSAAFDAVPAAGAGCAATDQRGARRPAGAACDAGAFEFGGPGAQTDPATSIADVSATVNGTLDARGLTTAYRFDYGLTEAYGSTVGGNTAALTPAAVSGALTGLAPTTTYHYRLVAVGPDGGSTGSDATFTTTARIPTTAPIPVPVPVGVAKLDRLVVAPKAFTVAAGSTPTGRSAAKRKVPRGTKITFRLSRAASVALVIERRTTGLLLTGKTGKRTCAKSSKGNRRTLEAQIRRTLGSKANGAAGRKRVARALARARCALYVSRGILRRAGAAGTNTVVFTGRIGNRALARAAYRVSASAAVGTGPRSPVVRASFSIVKP